MILRFSLLENMIVAHPPYDTYPNLVHSPSNIQHKQLQICLGPSYCHR